MCNQWCLEFGGQILPFIHKPARILEVGSRNVNGSIREILSEYASEYVGVDLVDGSGVDVVCNVADLSDTFPNQSFDFVVSTEMLEHCLNWQDALYQMVCVLKPDGFLLITTRSPGFELHDYPADHWRFSYQEFEEIFKPLGDIVAIQNDMTLGWPCGIGILVKRSLDQSRLLEWKLWLDTFSVYSMADETSCSTMSVNSNSEQMLFDQYSRYKACSDFLRQTMFTPGNTILDIGSGPECLFGHFMPDALMTYVDPLIPAGSGQGRITGDVFSNELDDQSFDCVTAVDVLEHVPPQFRESFLARLASLGKNTLIIAFPASDTHEAIATDMAINEQYVNIFSHNYSWLSEHHEYGLPSLIETQAQLKQLGWYCQTIGHGYTPWLEKLLGFVICLLKIPSMLDIASSMSEIFNRELYPYDFRSPSYRQFVIASRVPLPLISPPACMNNIEKADNVFHELFENGQRQFIIASFRALVEHDRQFAELNKKVMNISFDRQLQQEKIFSDKQVELTKVSDWARSLKFELNQQSEDIFILNELNAKIAEYDAKVAAYDAKVNEREAKVAEHHAKVVERNAKLDLLNSKMEEFSARELVQHEKISSLEQALYDKHAELVKMSDWAQNMMFEFNRPEVSIVSKAGKVVRRYAVFARSILLRSLLGKLVQRARAYLSFRKKQVSLEVLRQSVLDNQGRLIITFPIITWDFRWQRPQHMVSFLRDSGFAVLYVAMSLTPLGRRFCSKKEALANLHFNKLANHINMIWLHSDKTLNIYSDSIKDDDLFNISSGIDSLIAELRPKSIIYLVQFPTWGPVAQDLRNKLGGTILFDCMDNHSGFNTSTSGVLHSEELLLSQADVVMTSSNLLEAHAQRINTNTIQIKNGTDFEHFTNPTHNGKLDHLRHKPIVGYYGAISDWFDTQLVAYCALRLPDWNFVLIGATFGADLEPIKGLKNVHLLGEKSYQDLPGYLAYFDICTIPFKLNSLTLATNPVKFYEYLSAGKPVVSVRLPELIEYQEDCYLASNPDDFLAKLECAYKERHDEIKIERRLNLARENSWDARGRTLLESQIFQDQLQQAESYD